jgi:hypothetical protein
MPLVSKTFDQLLDFTRTTAATFVGSNGLIQNTPASVNLLTFTQQFDNAAWGKTATTITANSTVAPDGTSTADTLVADGTSNVHIVSAGGSGSATGKTFSIYAKAGTNSFLQVYFTTDGSPWANFDLSNGTVGSVGTTVTASITAAGDGWYRCVVATTSTTAANVLVNIIPASTSARAATSTLATTVFLWGAQLEVGTTATTYTRNNGGVFPPRFDYDPVTLAPKGLLVEEQRTNLTFHSGFTTANWTATGGTLANTGKTSPDGTSQMGLFTEDSATSAHQTFVTSLPAVFVLGTTYTGSVYLAAGTRRYVVVQSGGNGSGWGVTVDTQTWTITGDFATGGCAFTSASIVNVGNGIYRVTVTGVQNTGGGTSAYLVVGGSLIADALNAGTSYLGNGSTFFAWGAQVEAGAFATSYIPTVASQVTRTADQTSIVAPNFAPFYNQSEGTWTVSFSPYATNVGVVAQISAATNIDRFQLLNDNAAQIAVTTANVGQGTIDAGTVSVGATNNLAYAYRTNDTAASLNGGAAVADTTVTLPVVDRLSIGSTVTPAAFLNGHIRSVRYFPVRLSNAQLQALTA